MLYVSTKNPADTYTAYRALHETNTPDGGFYVPFHLPVFSAEELVIIRTQSCGDTVAKLLNLFFGLHLNSWDVECVIGRTPFKLETMPHKLWIAEGWRNPDASFRYLLCSLYNLMTDGNSMGKMPVGWSCVAIEIALLFGLYTSLEDAPEQFDVAVNTGDFAEVSALCYARDMGLPVNLIVCTEKDNSAFWDFIYKGDLSTAGEDPVKSGYFACFLYQSLGSQTAVRYLDACELKKTFRIDEVQMEALSSKLFPTVVSGNRVESITANLLHASGYHIDADAALAYGGLQDYRSSVGVSMDTLILSKKRPERIKE